MTRQRSHFAASSRYGATRVERSQHYKQALCFGNMSGRWRCKPRKPLYIATTPCCKSEHHSAEVGIYNFGSAVFTHTVLSRLRPKAVAYTFAQTSGTSGPLTGHVERNTLCHKLRKPCRRVEPHRAAKARIHNSAYTFDCERCLGYGSGKHNFTLALRIILYGPILLGR